MILGAYPCCDGGFALELPRDRSLPVYMRELCPHCGAAVWHYLTRIDPISWTETDFLAEHNVDEGTAVVTPKATDRSRR